MSLIAIDPELRSYLPGVPRETDAELEAQLRASGGPLDAFRVWKGRNILIDGHRRHAICLKLKLPWPTPIELEFADKDAVKHWMDTNQGCRRNETKQQQSERLVRMVAYERKQGKKRNEALDAVAGKEGVSRRTVQRHEHNQENLEKVTKDVREKIVTGDVEATAKDVEGLAVLTPEHQRAVVALVESGQHKSLGRALRGDDDAEGGENSDAVSQNSGKPIRPPAKPADSYLETAQELLGKLRNQVGSANDAAPGYRQFEPIQRALTGLDTLLGQWRRDLE